jgi:ABC-2 type transport system ATP-binding protein
MRTAELLSYFGELKGMRAREAQRSALEWLDRLQLADRADSLVESLSKGLSQRVQFACALVHDPELVILDEPMSGLDPIAADVIRDIIVSLAHQDEKTVLLSTHDLDGAERVCGDIVLIDRGHVVLQGDVTDVKAHYGKSAVAIFFEGDADFLRDHPAISEIAIYGGYADIELSEGGDPQTIFQACAGRIKVNRFELVEPSLTEVFRRTVGRSHRSTRRAPVPRQTGESGS